MSQVSYPFKFLSTSKTGADKYLQDTLIYSFLSQKSGHQYEVHIERYVGRLCGVKFFDLSTDLQTGKFSQLSGTYEPRTILRTVAEIALDAYRRDPLSSFFFVGAADSRDHSASTTRRHRVYATFVHNLELDDFFRTIELKDVSMSVLVNRKAVTDVDTYIQDIIDFVRA